MIHFKFSPQDNRYLFLKGDNKNDDEILINLKSYLNQVNPICYLPNFKGENFTEDFLFYYVQPSGQKIYWCSVGLWQTIYKWFKQNDVEFDGLIENKKLFKLPVKHTFEEFKEIVDSWNLKFPPRPYQYSYAYEILQWRMSISELATRAGKTMLAYIVFRYAMEYMGVKNILMIVPSIDLVKQGYNDFKEYAEFFNTECVWAGGKLVESSNLTIGTFQSLIKFLDKTSKKYNPSFYDKFDMVFVDETHRAKANQIKTIISHNFMKSIKIRFGMTGTVPKEGTIDNFCIHSLLGAKIQTIKPIELMEGGYISKVHITQVNLQYKANIERKELFVKCAEYALGETEFEPHPKNPKKKVAVKLDKPEFLIQYKKTYPEGLVLAKQSLMRQFGNDKNKFLDEYIKLLKKFISEKNGTNLLMIEKMMSHLCKERIDFLCDRIIPLCPNNMLILAHHTNYINYLTEIIKERFPDRNIDVITGSVDAKRRDEIKKMIKENNNCILIASYGCVGTGITLSNLCHGVLFESFKSDVITMQSIGRGLGLKNFGDERDNNYELYDFIDNFSHKIGGMRIAGQGKEKIKIYEENQYKYDIKNYSI